MWCDATMTALGFDCEFRLGSLSNSVKSLEFKKKTCCI